MALPKRQSPSSGQPRNRKLPVHSMSDNVRWHVRLHVLLVSGVRHAGNVSSTCAPPKKLSILHDNNNNTIIVTCVRQLASIRDWKDQHQI